MGRLRDKIHPFFLRREKGAPHSAHTQGRLKPYSEAAPKNIGSVSAHKVEVVVWAQLTPIQLTLYKGFLQSDDVKAVLNKDVSAAD